MSAAETSIPFVKLMRQRTRNIHDRSDALVNLKLGLTLSDETVWSEGILTFSNIFIFLENALTRNQDSLLGDLDIDGLRRTEAFHNDLKTLYGNDWEQKLHSMKETPAVKQYITHLEQIEDQNPYLLSAYIYHMYMGLLSGGQILSAKKKISRQAKDSEGERIFKVDKPDSVSSLKKKIREAMERMSEHLDEETKETILVEGIKVFQLNNTLIHSVKGVDKAFWMLTKKLLVIALFLVLVSYLIAKWYNTVN
jgi:heme oxygenase